MILGRRWINFLPVDEEVGFPVSLSRETRSIHWVRLEIRLRDRNLREIERRQVGGFRGDHGVQERVFAVRIMALESVASQGALGSLRTMPPFDEHIVFAGRAPSP